MKQRLDNIHPSGWGFIEKLINKNDEWWDMYVEVYLRSLNTSCFIIFFKALINTNLVDPDVNFNTVDDKFFFCCCCWGFIVY